MPIREILRAAVFLNRNADNKDFNEVVNCIPDARVQELEQELLVRTDLGEINTVRIGRYRAQATNFTEYIDEVDKFLKEIDSVQIKRNFTGFDSVD